MMFVIFEYNVTFIRGLTDLMMIWNSPDLWAEPIKMQQVFLQIGWRFFHAANTIEAPLLKWTDQSYLPTCLFSRCL